MKRHIENPYTVNWKMYGLIGGISIFIMIVSVIQNYSSHGLVSDIIKNLSLGCVASAIVALLIEIGNIRDKNEKANNIYDAVYGDLRLQILWYLKTWARFCKVAYKDQDYSMEKHTWIEWYEIAKTKFISCDDSVKYGIGSFLKEELIYNIEGVERALRQINNQEYILSISCLYNENLRSILDDFNFEFTAAKSILKSYDDTDYNTENFWSSFDAIKNDLIKYISNWSDIKYYNYLKFKPFDRNFDKTEIIKAVMESEKDSYQA